MGYINVCVLQNKSIGNCSNNGVSETHFDELYVEVAESDITLEQVEARGGIVLELIERNIGADTHKHFEPQLKSIAREMLMAGGCFIYSPDSRYRRQYGNYPLALHDRVE